MMVKAHVSPGLRVKTKLQIEQRSSWDHPENSRPSPQCGQRLRSPRRSAVLNKFERERFESTTHQLSRRDQHVTSIGADQVRNALRFIEPHPPLPVSAWTVPTHPHSEFSWR